MPAIRNAQDIIKQIVTCFKSSSKRTSLLKSIIRNEHDTRISKKHLISLCITRFVERHTAVQAFRSLLLYIVDAIQQMTQWHSYESRNTAQDLLNAISQPSFIISMVILEKLSSIMLPPTCNLQTVGIDVGTTMQSIDDLVIALEAMHCEEVFSKIFTCAQTIAQSLNIEIVKPRIPQRYTVYTVQRKQWKSITGNSTFMVKLVMYIM